MEKETVFLDSSYRIDYQLQSGDGPLIVLLHGYAQNGGLLLTDLAPALTHNNCLLIPNGPFPMPNKIKSIEALRYAWYFYDHTIDQYYIPYSIPAALIRNLIAHCQFNQREKIIIGYSQGGYLAPFAAEMLNNVKSVICINSSFRYDMMSKGKEKFLVHAINGANDNLVDPLNAQQSHKKLDTLKRRGDFNLVNGATHTINQAILEQLKKYLV